MVFSLKLVGDGNINITGRIHIEYENNMDLKNQTHDLDGKISKS
jgi:hypothetical protein